MPEEELRSRVRLKVGDRFDFYGWQQARDELERFYVDRDYLEARVRPQRSEGTDGSIAITFAIVRGPLSVLTIEGHQLPDAVIGQMRETWTRAVFDGFLLDELQTLAREHLVDEGFLQSELDTEVRDQRDAGRKEIVLRIAEGPRTAERRVEFRGNARLPADVLQTFIVRQGVGATAWADPKPLTRSLVVLYESEGMLETQISVGSPEFRGGVATLPVRVVEGPVYTISTVSVDGVDARPVDLVEALIRAQAGDIYAGIALTDARTRDRPELSPGWVQPDPRIGPVNRRPRHKYGLGRIRYQRGAPAGHTGNQVRRGRAHPHQPRRQSAADLSGPTCRPGRVESGAQAPLRNRGVPQR